MVKFLIFALMYVIFGWAIARSKILADIMLNEYGDDTSSFHVLEWIVFILEGPILFCIGLVLGIVKLIEGRGNDV